MKSPEGRVAHVAGAARGASRGIAQALTEAVAITYVTGRSTKSALSSTSRPRDPGPDQENGFFDAGSTQPDVGRRARDTLHMHVG